MYQELKHMWKMVFCKDSASRPSTKELLNLKRMEEMKLSNSLISGVVNELQNK